MTSLWVADSPDMVRAALDLSLDANTLPDEVIENAIFVDDAEDEVFAFDVNAAGYTDILDPTKKRRAERAVALLVASRMALQLPVILSEQLGDWRYQRQPYDSAGMYALLRRRALALIDLNTGNTGETTPLFAFGLASGSRGR